MHHPRIRHRRSITYGQSLAPQSITQLLLSYRRTIASLSVHGALAASGPQTAESRQRTADSGQQRGGSRKEKICHEMVLHASGLLDAAITGDLETVQRLLKGNSAISLSCLPLASARCLVTFILCSLLPVCSLAVVCFFVSVPCLLCLISDVYLSPFPICDEKVCCLLTVGGLLPCAEGASITITSYHHNGPFITP
jgi:hypothetical protein